MTAPVFPKGRIVGTRYAVEALLAKRPWATTYSAIAAPNRELVLKVIDPAIAAQAEATEMTRRIHAATNALGERYVVPVLESGRDAESGCGFVVMPSCAQPSLAQLVQLCPLMLHEATVFARNLAALLDTAHAAGILHLALKPSNVFVGPAPEHAVRVADFGAGALRRDVAPSERGAISGDWLAPEQLTAPNEDRAGPAADVFALARLLFYALTGKPMGASSAPASQRARELGVTLPAAVDAVFARALATDPAARFRTGAELVAAFAQATAIEAKPRPAAREAVPRAPPRPEPRPEPVASTPALAITIAEARPAAPPPAPIADDIPVVLAEPEPEPAPSVAEEPELALPLTRRRTREDRRRVALVAVLGTLGLGAIALGAVIVMRPGAASPPAASTRAAVSAAAKPAPPSSAPAPIASDAHATAANVDAPAAALDAGSFAPDAPSTLLVICEPACERVLVNGKPLAGYPDAATLPPGRYGVGVGRRGFGGQYQMVKLEPGQRETVRFTLFPQKAP